MAETGLFLDGLRCAGGGLVRLQIRTASGSGASQTTIVGRHLR